MSCKRYPRIFDYIDLVKSGKIRVCQDQMDMIDNIVLPVLNRDDVFVDEEKIEKGLSLQKYFPFELLPWEIFIFALVAGVFIDEEGEYFAYFKNIDILVGRGSGKNGFISFLCFYFLSNIHGIQNYNIDILANSEDQAKTSFNDVYDVITNAEAKYKATLLKNFYATKTAIKGKATNSILRFNSSSAKGKDSKRTGCIILDEVHEYTDNETVKKLKSGLGKIKDPRIITITTDGEIRGAYIDKMKEKDHKILKQYDPENRTLVFFCHIEAEDEYLDPENLVKAIPSIIYPAFRHLRREILDEIHDMPNTPDYYGEFMAKRMNYPVGDSEVEVASWDDIVACNQPVPNVTGVNCVGAVDFAKTNDFVSVGIMFFMNNRFYVIHHTFVCTKSRDLKGIKVKEQMKAWEAAGYLTYVEDAEIPAELVVDWFYNRILDGFNIVKIAIDDYRFSFLNFAFKKIGFTAYKDDDSDIEPNIKLVRRWDIMKIAPIVNSAFVTQSISWGEGCGDNGHIMAWYTNNVKVVYTNGNMTYGKIEEHYRKTDGFMMLVNLFVLQDLIKIEYDTSNFGVIGVW